MAGEGEGPRGHHQVVTFTCPASWEQPPPRLQLLRDVSPGGHWSEIRLRLRLRMPARELPLEVGHLRERELASETGHLRFQLIHRGVHRGLAHGDRHSQSN